MQRGKKRLPNDLGVGVYSFICGDYGDPRKMAQDYICHFTKLSKHPEDSWVVLELDISQAAIIVNLNDEMKAINQFRTDNAEAIKRIVETEFTGKQNDGLKHRGNFDGIVIKLFLEHLLSDYPVQLDGVVKDTFTNGKFYN